MKERNNTNLSARKIEDEPEEEDHEQKIKEMFDKFSSNRQ
jgi:hypothetical protein